MSMRLQVVMSDEEHEEIRRAARSERLTVSEWVRQVLRTARERGPRSPAVVGESGRSYAASADALRQRVHVELELDEALVEAVRRRYHQPTWRAAVEYALRRVAVSPMSREEALDMRGVGWDGDLGELRGGDPGAAW